MQKLRNQISATQSQLSVAIRSSGGVKKVQVITAKTSNSARSAKGFQLCSRYLIEASGFIGQSQ